MPGNFNFVAASKVAHNHYQSLTPAKGDLSFVSNLLTNHTGQFKMKVNTFKYS